MRVDPPAIVANKNATILQDKICFIDMYPEYHLTDDMVSLISGPIGLQLAMRYGLKLMVPILEQCRKYDTQCFQLCMDYDRTLTDWIVAKCIKHEEMETVKLLVEKGAQLPKITLRDPAIIGNSHNIVLEFPCGYSSGYAYRLSPYYGHFTMKFIRHMEELGIEGINILFEHGIMFPFVDYVKAATKRQLGINREFEDEIIIRVPPNVFEKYLRVVPYEVSIKSMCRLIIDESNNQNSKEKVSLLISAVHNIKKMSRLDRISLTWSLVLELKRRKKLFNLTGIEWFDQILTNVNKASNMSLVLDVYDYHDNMHIINIYGRLESNTLFIRGHKFDFNKGFINGIGIESKSVSRMTFSIKQGDRISYKYIDNYTVDTFDVNTIVNLLPSIASYKRTYLKESCTVYRCDDGNPKLWKENVTMYRPVPPAT